MLSFDSVLLLPVSVVKIFAIQLPLQLPQGLRLLVLGGLLLLMSMSRGGRVMAETVLKSSLIRTCIWLYNLRFSC